MKMFKLIEDDPSAYKKGTKFFLISHSEFIGVKSYVLLAEDLKGRVEVTEEELRSKFVSVQ
ncbi:hypothetical protein IOC57_15155 [Bacillus sp. SD075]|uniref:hypothetical protein n=1 Tax=Bacillus sp. SD075 TaxID=2781732 RepID=UPI001A976325|nr:hypothetical protein [Bacillus sp. SD075]MBO0999071.1 hypothetical protein [Bacillus sp. SD075]